MKGQFRVKYDRWHNRFRVEGKINRTRHRYFFESAAEADKFASAKNKEVRAAGHVLASIGPELRADALYAKDRGVNIRAAVDLWLATHDTRSKSITVTDACGRARTWSEGRLNGNEIGIDMHRGILNVSRKFEGAFGARLICDLTALDLSNWLSELPVATASKNAYRLSLSSIFSFAKDQQWVKANPVLEIKKKTDRVAEAQMRQIYSLEQAARLLEAATPELVPYLAIGLFAGLRPTEILRSNWENIDWEEKHIDVRADVCKTGERRFVTLSDNLLEWLAPYRKESGPLFSGSMSVLLRGTRALSETTGIPWLKDGLRHSFSSYHCASTKNEALTAHEAGHSISVMKKHYLRRVTPAQGAAYFQIRPAKSNNVVELKAA